MISHLLSLALTNRSEVGTLWRMALTLQRLDPERHRRRLQLLAELSGAKAVRDRVQPRRLRTDRLRELIATRRRLAS
jgi:hypothetical protein